MPEPQPRYEIQGPLYADAFIVRQIPGYHGIAEFIGPDAETNARLFASTAELIHLVRAHLDATWTDWSPQARKGYLLRYPDSPTSKLWGKLQEMEALLAQLQETSTP